MSSVMRFDEWQDSDGNPVFNGAGGVSPGGLVAVKSAIRTAPEVFSNVEGSGNRAVGGLSITHEVADPANRLIISAFFGAAGHSAGFGQVGLAIHDGTELIGIGDTPPGAQTRVAAGGNVDQGGGNQLVTMPSVTFVHTPGAGSKTYTVRAVNIRGDTVSMFINRNQFDSNSAAMPRAVSVLVIQEVAV